MIRAVLFDLGSVCGDKLLEGEELTDENIQNQIDKVMLAWK